LLQNCDQPKGFIASRYCTTCNLELLSQVFVLPSYKRELNIDLLLPSILSLKNELLTYIIIIILLQTTAILTTDLEQALVCQIGGAFSTLPTFRFPLASLWKLTRTRVEKKPLSAKKLLNPEEER
jgi:hypothetical protein